MLTTFRLCLALLSVLPLFAQSLDWTGDVTLFGSTGDESSPLMVTAVNGNSIRAFCLRDDSQLCSKISTDGGTAWSTSSDTALTVSAFSAAADDRFQYLFIRHAAASAAFLLRCPSASNNWHSYQQIEIAPSRTGNIAASALMVDALFAPNEPYLNLCWCESAASGTVNIWFAQSRNRGESFRQEHNVHSFVTSVDADDGLTITAAWSGEEERLLIAAVVDRPGSIPEQIRVFFSDDQGETWSDSGGVDDSFVSQTEPAIAALGDYVILSYLRSAYSRYHELCMSFSYDGGQTFAQPFVISDTLTDECSPRLLINPADSLYYLFSLRAEDSIGTATVLMRTGRLDRPWNISEALAICEPGSAVLAGGLTAVMNVNGPAVAWTGRFLAGDTDIRFDAAWRGNSVSGHTFAFPSGIALGSCYPNPFNAMTVLPLMLNRPTPISIELFDISGRRVTAFHYSLLPVGEHRILLDLSGLPSGIYMSKIDGCEPVQKLFMIK
ncbi:T9SS C-terminal target domain-containing protein [candidate division KSB1 bacterium]|nr:MAG: T9SS C-terminal target domain-containing protein [candidate division KSB1 bacterium]